MIRSGPALALAAKILEAVKPDYTPETLTLVASVIQLAVQADERAQGDVVVPMRRKA